ncbi:aminotransferase class IV family protein [Mannheimia massilioguelmaensis]|uniref:aminotransferase class IV family protein n=1 Tax=Mannheimia massilioguelmaensis TaxID=1604354 RepID=UPI0009E52857|nr:aminotransferase class IV family protein [Mannheimia massilioguelmaensis]
MQYPLFETIAIEQGKIQNIQLHQMRYEHSLSLYYANRAYHIFDLGKILQKSTALLALQSQHNLIRCRINYNYDSYQIQCFPYMRKHYHHFQPIIGDNIDYPLKYTDRHIFDNLLKQKNNCDEIIIIKNGFVTDCSIGNLIFKKDEQWFTPDTPLLIGTQRTKLLSEKKIKERRIRLEDIGDFEEIRIINAMNPL